MGLEDVISRISPGWALKRSRARAYRTVLENQRELTQRRFEGADRGRRTQGWISVGGSANAELRGSLSVLRERCRDLKRNNPHAASAVRTLVSNIVGTGILPRFVSDSDALERQARDLWKEWSGQPGQIDADGRSTFAAFQTTAVEEMVEAGEVIVRRRRRRASDNLVVPLQVQLLEGDHIDTARDGEVERNGNRTVLGVEFNGIGRRRGYWIFPEHPGSLSFQTRVISRFIRSDEILHLYRLDRASQVRGVPWGSPTILRIHGFDAYEDNEALRNVVATSYAAFVKDMDAGAALGALGPGGALPNQNASGLEIDEIESGTVERLPPGTDITFTTPPQNETFPDYARVSLRAIAKGYGVTYENLTGDLSGVNFSSARMGWIDFQLDVKRWRDNTVVPHLCEPIARWFMGAAIAAGLLPEAGISWEWAPPRREMVDPRTDVNMEIALVRAGMKSLSDAVSSMGFDLRTVLEQLANDLKRARDLGLVLSTDGTMDMGPQQDNVNRPGGGGSRDFLNILGEHLIRDLENRGSNGTIQAS